jgi:hypothetical protein
MSQQPIALVLTMLVLIPGGLAGCGPSDDTMRIKLVPVNGTVTFNGQPLEGARVTFSPDDANERSTPGGDVTGPAGNYKAMFRNRSGLAPGMYKIIVEKIVPPAGVKAEDTDINMHLESLNPKEQTKGQKRESTQIRGDFEAEVPAGGGILDFDVKGKAKPVSESKAGAPTSKP